jgi:hypothetical protein
MGIANRFLWKTFGTRLSPDLPHYQRAVVLGLFSGNQRQNAFFESAIV